MVLRNSARQKSLSRDCSKKYIVPPWCSSSATYLGIKHKDPRRTRKVISEEKRNINARKSNDKHAFISWHKFIIFLLIIGLGLHWMSDKIPRDLISNNFWAAKFISLMRVENSPLVQEKCSDSMWHLSLKLSSAELALRKALRVRKTGPYPRYEATLIENTKFVRIKGATAVMGQDTSEWGGEMALWGLIPLWRAAPPPNIVLSTRNPTPSDCWPFRGSSGEIIVNLDKTQVDHVSVEHVWPDTARSAPKRFTIYGTLTNGTWLKAFDGVYHNSRPTKQYYSLLYKNMIWTQIVFKVLSNQGNPKYTCIYRFHLYKNQHSTLVNTV